MTSLRSQRRELPWRRNDGTPVGRINDTVALLRQPKPEASKGRQRAYGPKGSARRARQHGAIIDETTNVVEQAPAVVEQPKPKPMRDKFGRFVKRLVNDQ